MKLLKMSYGFVNNYGIAIIFITLLIRIIFLPLTIKSMMSMKKMQSKMALMKPKLDAVKEQYKDDKTKSIYFRGKCIIGNKKF